MGDAAAHPEVGLAVSMSGGAYSLKPDRHGLRLAGRLVRMILGVLLTLKPLHPLVPLAGAGDVSLVVTPVGVADLYERPANSGMCLRPSLQCPLR
jgi:hypothetical protein